MTNTQKRLILIISGLIIIALIFFVVTKPVKGNRDKVQVVHMAETAQGYTPNEFTIKKGVPVNLIVTAKEVKSCAGVLLIPKFKIREFLKAGDNTIEFTPNNLGTIPFSCSMGMFKGTFTVTN